MVDFFSQLIHQFILAFGSELRKFSQIINWIQSKRPILTTYSTSRRATELYQSSIDIWFIAQLPCFFSCASDDKLLDGAVINQCIQHGFFANIKHVQNGCASSFPTLIMVSFCFTNNDIMECMVLSQNPIQLSSISFITYNKCIQTLAQYCIQQWFPIVVLFLHRNVTSKWANWFRLPLCAINITHYTLHFTSIPRSIS